jgi:hypothetical protein
MTARLPDDWPADTDPKQLQFIASMRNASGEAAIYLMPRYSQNPFYIEAVKRAAGESIGRLDGDLFVWFEPLGARRFDIGVANFKVYPHD